MTGLKVLSNSFNKIIALTEFGSNYVLAFFVLFCLYIFKRAKVQSKLVKSLAFTLITFMSIIMFWAISKAVSNDIPIMYINPITVIFDSIVEIINIKSPKISSFIGLPYVLGFQFLGSLAGFITFVLIFYLFKKVPSNYFEENEKYTLKDILFSNHNEKTLAFSLKEIMFILIMTITISLTSRNSITYGFNHFTLVLANMILLFTILLISSYFNFFTFHIFLGTGFTILNLITSKNKKEKIKIITHYFIDFSATILIPAIIALLTILIIKGGKQKYAY
ncbi:Uncharacterised protein [Mycoplasmopsis maculosa]|uniref:Uncharacterized protein n=1 Tax=Mycoplasmopsis maculosa TaxID=114885 RepID=A0A449B3C1_9BACT|nr:hypothetical protein [Mycoplasmopsis maculosa]VEU75101.1 Uncharacterised protein [Mycoplasmopsis maculosa]